MSCMHCVAHVTQALKALDGAPKKKITLIVKIG